MESVWCEVSGVRGGQHGGVTSSGSHSQELPKVFLTLKVLGSERPCQNRMVWGMAE